MENKINIAEILRNCPQGMELDYMLCEDTTFDRVSDYGNYPIRIKTPCGEIVLTKYGQQYDNESSKCVIYPKGKTSWVGFVPPCRFKDGDIVASNNGEYIFMLKKVHTYRDDDVYNVYNGTCYFGLGGNAKFLIIKEDEWYFNRLATEEEKQKLFQAIKEQGYKWNAEKKALEKLIEPKFKVGDRVRHKDDKTVITITGIKDDYYFMQFYYPRRRDYQKDKVSFKYQDEYELFLPNKFDINTLVPFESKVLVRCADGQLWSPAVYGFAHSKGYLVVGPCGCWSQCIMHMHQCIPYEGNEHLLDTTADCEEYYKTWK